MINPQTDVKHIATRMVVLLVAILMFTSVSGQKPYFRSMKVPDEVQQTSITCLYQDDNSYMWIGTGKGLYRFDGNDFIYFPGNGKESSLQISAIFMSPEHVLWVGTRKGEIYRQKGDSIFICNPDKVHVKSAITGFVTDKQGALWFSTYGEGLYCLNGQNTFNINTENGLTDNYCYTLMMDKQGRIWAATDGGISVCNIINGRKYVQKITSAEGLPDNIVLSLMSEGESMWAGMQDAGICKVDMKTLKVSVPEASKGWTYGPVSSIVAGRNWIWASTEHNGIISIETSGGRMAGNYTSTDNLGLSHINHMYADKQGNYWVVSGNQLLLSLGNDLLYYSMSDPLKGKNINSLLTDSQGNLWYSCEGRLFSLNGQSGATTEISLPLKKHTHIISLYQDERGYIWAGTFGSGLFCIDPAGKRTRLFSESEGLSNGNILSISGKGKVMWLATLGGAYKCEISGDPLSGKSQVLFINFGDQHFPGNNYIYSVFTDSRNRVWFGTDGKGISVLENGRFTNFDKAQGLKSNIIYSITEDSDGDIWFSTSNAGIYRYNGKTFRNYSPGDGLSDIHITGLLADKSRHLLIIHNNGVDILDTRNNEFVYYTAGVGMSEINPDLNVCILEGSNIAWIGTHNGLIRIQIPEDILKQQPSLQMEVISLFPAKGNQIGTHTYFYDQNYISFHFNALWYIAPSLIRYQIRLQGYDRDWTDTRNNQVTYSNLPPGDYTFEVRSSIEGNFTRSDVKSYTFTIGKPFWKTSWFIIVSVLAFSLLVYLVVHLRENALKRRDAMEREKIMFQFQTLRSQVNPHFLFNSFSTLITIIDEDKEVAIRYVEKLSQFFRDILDYRDKDLIALSEELKLIDTYYFLQKKRYCENLQLDIQVGENELQSLIPPMVLQMLVENAIKHNVVSAEKPLTVRIYTEGRYIIVSNSLQPKKAGLPSTGIGLANIRNRYLLLGFGETVIDTSEDKFIVKLPVIYPGK